MKISTTILQRQLMAAYTTKSTPASNRNAKLKRESFTISELDEIAKAVGVIFEKNFVLGNGDKI